MPHMPLAGSMPARGICCSESQCLDLLTAFPIYETAVRHGRLLAQRSAIAWAPASLPSRVRRALTEPTAQGRRAKTPPGLLRAGRCCPCDQSPFDLRPRDHMRLKVSPPSASKRLAYIGVVK